MFKPAVAISCVALRVTDISTEPATVEYISYYKDLVANGDPAWDPEGKTYQDLDVVTENVYEGLENYWSCVERNSEQDEYTSFYCNQFQKKWDLDRLDGP